MYKSIIRNYNRIPFKKGSLGFHLIPYHLQYESRDFDTKCIVNPTLQNQNNIEKYIREFNPYLKFHVSEDLDERLIRFYRNRYNKR
jgi:hypothetical protein